MCFFADLKISKLLHHTLNLFHPDDCHFIVRNFIWRLLQKKYFLSIVIVTFAETQLAAFLKGLVSEKSIHSRVFESPFATGDKTRKTK